MNCTEYKKFIADDKLNETLINLYGEANLETQKSRYLKAVGEYEKIYGNNDDTVIFSVPGRSEISGNHTDHNHGCVIAASVDLDIIAVASKNESGMIRIKSEGFDEDIVDISDLKINKDDYYTSASLIRGMCDGFDKRKYHYGAFNAYTTSNVLKGSGLSSSAAFEVMIGNILNHFYNDGKIAAPEIAKIAQYAENEYFGKPCGLMDQTACAVGGFVTIDFNDPTSPIIEKLEFDLSAYGYSLCIVDTGGNHADLNDDYASIPTEMKRTAKYFGQDYLRGLTVDQIIGKIPMLRSEVGDRAVLRALHFITENDRVNKQAEALRNNNLDEFLSGVTESGNSSYKKLQNIYTIKNVEEQGLSVALALAENFIKDKKAACRVHGGGFAGTIQAFIPDADVEEFKSLMDNVFGNGACINLSVRACGAIKVE